jgi:hypothetical protein
VTSRINFITHYRNRGHDTKLNTLAANVAALFDIGLALFYRQQTFRAIFIANGTAAAFLSIDRYFGSTTIFHKSNSALSFDFSPDTQYPPPPIAFPGSTVIAPASQAC